MSSPTPLPPDTAMEVVRFGAKALMLAMVVRPRVSICAALKAVTAIRLEALPDDRLPRRGPGRVASRSPGQPAAGCGACQRSTPTGGAAYGMP